MNWKEGEIEFPDGLTTSGEARVQFTGNKSKYLITGNYLIKNGRFEKIFQ